MSKLFFLTTLCLSTLVSLKFTVHFAEFKMKQKSHFYHFLLKSLYFTAGLNPPPKNPKHDC